MLSNDTVNLIRHFLRKYPTRSAALVFLLLLAGLAEGIGVMTLLPVIEIAMMDADQLSGLSRSIVGVLATLGLPPALPVLLSIVVLATIAKGIIQFYAQKQVGTTVAQVATDLRLDYIGAILNARWSYFVNERAGRIATAMSGEAMRAAQSYRHACAALGAMIHAGVYAAIALRISWPVAVMALAAGGVISLLLGRLVQHSRIAGRKQTDMTKALVTRITDALHGIKAVKAMGREDRLQPLLEAETQGINDAYRSQVIAAETTKAAHEPLLVIMLACALYVAIGTLNQPLASVMVLAFLFHRLAGRMNLVQSEYQTLATGESAFYSIRSAIEAARGAAEGHHGGRNASFDRSIDLHNVSFAYGSKQVLSDVSFTIPAGSFVTIVGPSGSGKTTIADLLVGLIEPTAGSILVDGIPLSEFATREWRNAIGYVPQEMFLFHDTLRTNITLGAEGIPDEVVWSSLAQSGAADFVRALPAGLETIVGERGARLSGGQRQRIAIARALCASPSLLILDEVTASLDPITEAALCETLKGLRGQVTILAISHQPALMDPADIVYTARDGRVFARPEHALAES